MSAPPRLRTHWLACHFFLIKIIYHFNTLVWQSVCMCNFFVAVVNEDLCKIHPRARVNDMTTSPNIHSTHTRIESAVSIYITPFFLLARSFSLFARFKRFNLQYLHIFYEVPIQKPHDILYSFSFSLFFLLLLLLLLWYD